jgi:hypothetical protein
MPTDWIGCPAVSGTDHVTSPTAPGRRVICGPSIATNSSLPS